MRAFLFVYHHSGGSLDILFFSSPLTVHGGWSVWTQWDDCSTTCGTGTQERFRECNNPPPQYNGSDCKGDLTEIRQCPGLPPCPVDCKWNAWSSWTECSLSCANGTQLRTRTFEPARHGGRDCIGEPSSTQFCNTQRCPGIHLIPQILETVGQITLSLSLSRSLPGF